MSSARTNPGADHGIYPGDAIAAEMHAARLPSEPRQFEFWFAYKNGRNAALNAAANDIKSRNGALTGPDIDRLHEAKVDDVDAKLRIRHRSQRLADVVSRRHMPQ